jgi:hypothetical protein
MAEEDEIDALQQVIPSAATGLIVDINDRMTGPARDANSPAVSTGFLVTGGRGLLGDPSHGTVFVPNVPVTPDFLFLRLDTDAGSYFSSLARHPDGQRRLLQRFADTAVDLAATAQQKGILWNVQPFAPGSSELRLTTGSGSSNALTTEGTGGVFTSPGGTPWTWTGTPPPPPAPPPPARITVEAFWWGFHFRIPEDLLSTWVAVGFSVGEILDVVADATGPAAPFVDLAATYIEEEFDVARRVDQGNGVFVSMSWFAPGLFVPTPI